MHQRVRNCSRHIQNGALHQRSVRRGNGALARIWRGNGHRESACHGSVFPAAADPASEPAFPASLLAEVSVRVAVWVWRRAEASARVQVSDLRLVAASARLEEVWHLGGVLHLY